uniref:Macro domain-containing protein n=1 Tax=Xiphophorus maculatus TaxID=8083 RepID=A0A3B5QK26_XIPMA
MRPHFCSVDLDQPEVKLSPLPSFLRQKSLTAKDVDNWAEAAKDAFCKLLAQYSAFECDANTEAWKAAEKEVLSVVKEDALVEFDPSRQVVTVAGRADDIKKIRAPVENILLKLMILVSVSRADICSFKVDAVVNAANEDLQHIGGLALALLKAAGPNLQKISNDLVAKDGKLRPGDAVVTDGCSLPCRYVVHAVGPRYSDSDKKTSVFRLKCAVRESLSQAERASCSTVAMPAISSGVFGFPVELCTETIARAVREYCDDPSGPGSLTEVHLVDNNDATVRMMAAAVSREFSDLEPIMTVPQPAAGKHKGAAG